MCCLSTSGWPPPAAKKSQTSSPAISHASQPLNDLRVTIHGCVTAATGTNASTRVVGNALSVYFQIALTRGSRADMPSPWAANGPAPLEHLQITRHRQPQPLCVESMGTPRSSTTSIAPGTLILLPGCASFHPIGASVLGEKNLQALLLGIPLGFETARGTDSIRIVWFEKLHVAQP